MLELNVIKRVTFCRYNILVFLLLSYVTSTTVILYVTATFITIGQRQRWQHHRFTQPTDLHCDDIPLSHFSIKYNNKFDHTPTISLSKSKNDFEVSSWSTSSFADKNRRKSLFLSLGGIISSFMNNIDDYDNKKRNFSFAAAAAAVAEDAIVESSGTEVDMKLFADPLNLFVVEVPARYYVVRRTAKGDLPDEKTGKGRRGSSIFTAGDLAKTEVVSIERYPIRVLLEENGISVSANDRLSTFADIGEPYTIANLITIRREKDRPGTSNTRILRETVKVSDDGKDLYFMLETNIAVQKPELLLEQTGMTQLVRITTAKASLRSNDGQLLSIYASALENDFRGPDGTALQKSVKSFLPVDQSQST